VKAELLHGLHPAARHLVLVRVDVIRDVLHEFLVLAVRAGSELEQRARAVHAVVRVPPQPGELAQAVVQRRGDGCIADEEGEGGPDAHYRALFALLFCVIGPKRPACLVLSCCRLLPPSILR
jgi:hypothetical protein